jgi:hypothetical protein
MANPSTQEYITVIEAPPIKSLASWQADVVAFQATVPMYGAELSIESVPLQNAVITETDPAYSGPLNNAYQRSSFLQNRLERLSLLLQEIRVGCIDLSADQAAVIAGGYPTPAGPTA